MIKMKNKRAQEEIVGFTVIVIIVSIILIFFLLFSLSKKTVTDSYEAESFLQSSLHYTSECINNDKFLTIQKLIVSCYNKENCDNGQDACMVLNETLKGILKESWQTGQDFPVKGYDMEISSGNDSILSLKEGNLTRNYKGTQQKLPESSATITVLFNLYY